MFSGSFSATNVLATIPVWGPDYQVSFEVPPLSHCGGETDCTMIVFTNTAARVPATFLTKTELGFNLKIKVDLGESKIFAKNQEWYLVHK